MLSKNKSTQLSKLKYLLIIPVLLSMLVYTSCEKGEFEQINKNEKRLTSIFIGSLDNSGVKEIKSKTREHYFDFYFDAEPQGKEISYDDLSNDEKKEYDKIYNGFNKNGENFNTFKIYEDEYGKRSLLMETDWKAMKESRESNNYSNADEVPFAVIEKSPIFPGCENAEDQKKCFEESISNYITQNFDPSLAKSLGLERVKKNICSILIKKNGQVSYIRLVHLMKN